MSDKNRSNALDIFNLSQYLQEAGWDAFASDLTGEVAARRDYPPTCGVWSLTIDRSGRWRFTAICQSEMAGSREVERGDHTFRVLKEMQQVLTVVGNLESREDLPGMLDELTQLAMEETSQEDSPAAGELTWRKNYETAGTNRDL